MAVAISRPACAHDGRPPAAQRGGVEDVVVDERRRVHELDRDGGAHERARRGASAPAASSTSSGRSRLPPAAIVAAGVLGRAPAPCAAGRSRPARSSTRASSARARAGPPASTIRRRTGSAAGALSLGPSSRVEGDDPAGRQDPADVAQPGARHARRQPLGRRGSA